MAVLSKVLVDLSNQPQPKICEVLQELEKLKKKLKDQIKDSIIAPTAAELVFLENDKIEGTVNEALTNLSPPYKKISKLYKLLVKAQSENEAIEMFKKAIRTKLLQLSARPVNNQAKGCSIEVEVTTFYGVYSAIVSAPNREHLYGTVEKVNEIVGQALLVEDLNVTDQREIDSLVQLRMIPENDSDLSGLLAISMAVCKAGSASSKIPLYMYIARLAGTSPKPIMPKPAFEVARCFDPETDERMIQTLILQNELASLSLSLETALAVHQQLVKNKVELVKPIEWQPVLKLVDQAIRETGNAERVQIDVTISSSFSVDYQTMAEEFPVISIQHSDLSTATCADLKKKGVHVVRDSKNILPLMQAVGDKDGDSLLLLLQTDRFGTISSAIEAHNYAKKNGWRTVVAPPSQESGETVDKFLAELAVGLSADQINVGAPSRSERSLINNLIKIETMMFNGSPIDVE